MSSPPARLLSSVGKIFISVLRKVRDVYTELMVAWLIVDERSDNKKGTLDPGNFFVGLIEFIEEYAQQKHIFLPKRAYVSFYIGIYTFFILYFIANKSPVNDFRSYSWSFLFLGYSLLHYLWEVKVHESNRNIERMKENRVAYMEVARIIRDNTVKNPETIINFVDTSINNREDIQLALLAQYDKITTPLVEYIQRKILEVEFFPRAVGKFLSVTSDSRLEKSF